MEERYRKTQLAKRRGMLGVREIVNVQDLEEICGLQLLLIPKQEWAWSPGMRPHVIYTVESWPGYHETKRMDVHLPSLLEDALLSNGWTRKDNRYWWEYSPPERGPDDPAS